MAIDLRSSATLPQRRWLLFLSRKWKVKNGDYWRLTQFVLWKRRTVVCAEVLRRLHLLALRSMRREEDRLWSKRVQKQCRCLGKGSLPYNLGNAFRLVVWHLWRFHALTLHLCNWSCPLTLQRSIVPAILRQTCFRFCLRSMFPLLMILGASSKDRSESFASAAGFCICGQIEAALEHLTDAKSKIRYDCILLWNSQIISHDGQAISWELWSNRTDDEHNRFHAIFWWRCTEGAMEPGSNQLNR